MKLSRLLTLLAASALGALLPAQAQIFNVTSKDINPAQLVNKILGPGVQLVGTPSTSGGATAFGIFSGGDDAGIEMNSGIILSTGDVSQAFGPNDYDDTTWIYGTSSLYTVNGVPNTEIFDQATLEFQFKFNNPPGNSIFLKFVFASEEYNEWVGSEFFDNFELLVNGVNVAKIPGSNDTVSLNTVNSGANHTYFKNNRIDGAVNPYPYNIEYDGLTVPITVEVPLDGRDVHDVKFTIFDLVDGAYDSAIFIQAGSFSLQDSSTAIPEPATVGLFGFLALGAYLLRRRAVAKVA